jgi:hypothetical protein
LGDVLAMVLAFGLATAITVWLAPSSSGAWLARQDLPRLASWGAVGLLGIVLLLTRYQHYSDRRPFWDELGDFIRLVGLLALIDIAVVATAQWNVSRLWWGLSWSLTLPSLVLLRMGMRTILRRQKLWLRPTIIIGVGPNAADAACDGQLHKPHRVRDCRGGSSAPSVAAKRRGFRCRASGSMSSETGPQLLRQHDGHFGFGIEPKSKPQRSQYSQQNGGLGGHAAFEDMR